MTSDEAIGILKLSCAKNPKRIWSIQQKQATDMAIEALKHKQEWIPCSSKLPEECERVLMFYERNAYNDEGCYRKVTQDVGWQVNGNWFVDGCSGVVGIAWMPLPEPYKAGE